MRQRYKPWADDFLKDNEHFMIQNPEQHRGNWQQLFTKKQPIHLEIGTGKGQFIVNMAKQNPDINFIGLELAKSIIVTAGEKILNTKLPNVLLIHADANHLTDYFADDEVENIYLNFSDPWPKKRHEKRRLTSQSFLKQYKKVLVPNGELIFKTDNQGLFEYSLVSISNFPMILKEVNLDLHTMNDPTNIMTEYEEKFSAKGHLIYRLKANFEK